MVQLWDARTGRRWHKITHDAAVSTVAFNPDGGWLAAGDTDGNVQIWNTHSGKQLVSVTHRDRINGVAFSPDKHSFATGSSDRTARIWDAYTGEQKIILRHDYPVCTVTFSPDGRLLATAGTPARIWDSQTGTELLNLSPEPGSSRFCADIAFSSDSRFLAAAYMDHTARIWDTHTGMELLTLTHDKKVHAVAFSPNGRLLATGDGAWQASGRGPGTVRVWQLNET